MTEKFALWEAEFGASYKVPAKIANHPGLYDLSWHNDICPSFTTQALAHTPSINEDVRANDLRDVRLWVEHVDPMGRCAIGKQLDAEYFAL